jgi:15-cis-phytoene desaturase
VALNADVLVAGAGIAGLACAAAQSGFGQRVAVFESDATLGGRAIDWRDEVTGDDVDIGPHVLSNEHHHFLALLRRLGTADKVLWQADPFITLLDRGRHLRISSPAWLPPFQGLPNLPEVLGAVSPRDLLSNWRVAWQAVQLDECGTLALDGEDAQCYLRRMGVSARMLEWFWTPTVMALLNVPLQRCSAASMMRIFRLMLGRSGYHFGFPRIGLGQLYAPGCRRVIEQAGGAVRTMAAVREVVIADGRFHGFVLERGERVQARCGVLALPPQALAQVCGHGAAAAPLRALAQRAGRFQSCPYVSTMLWFDRKVTQERFWARVWRPGDLNTDFYDLANIRQQPPEGSMVVSNAIYAHATWGWSDERIIEQTRREVAEFAPLARRAGLLHARVHRTPMAIPCPLPGSERLRPDNQTAVPGLWVAGDWTATAVPCSMESAARSAAITAEAAAAEFGRHVRPASPPPDCTGTVALLREWRVG